MRMSQKKFKEWFTHYFGLHSVAVGAAIMYAPFVPQVVFALVFMVCFGVSVVLNSCRKVGAVRILFNVLMVVAVLMDVILLFVAAMGVGAAGYDTTQKVCYLQR
jgi:hypothetical protein